MVRKCKGGSVLGIPFQVQEFLIDENVDLASVKSLNGVNSERGIFSFRFSSQNKSYIVKKCIWKREFDVYNAHSLFFKENNINIPKMYFSWSENSEHWIVIEDIPQPFPRIRWKADMEQIKLLYLLHSKSMYGKIDLADPYHSMWNDNLIENIEQLLPLDLKIRLDNIKATTGVLFNPLCCISGDPNPTNWGIRKNGDIVLFDFERIGYGNPAIDLSITIPGFGTNDSSLEREIATKYISLWNKDGLKFPFTVEELTQYIHIGKIWSALDFLNKNYKPMNQEHIQNYLKHLTEQTKLLC